MAIFQITNPRIGSGSSADTYPIYFKTNHVVNRTQFLRTIDGTFSNVNPSTVPLTSTIETVAIYCEPNELDQYDLQIFVNGVQVYTFTKIAGIDRVEDNSATISVVQGDRISVRIANLLAPIDKPGCALIFSV